MKKRLILIYLLSWFAIVGAQDLSPDFKNWYIGSLNLKLDKKHSLRLTQLSSFDTKSDGYSLKFGQSTALFRKRLSKQWMLGTGYSYSFIRGRKTTLKYHRAQVAVRHRVRLGHFRLSHDVQLEKYWPALTKFHHRMVIAQKWSYYNKNWPLKFSPFIRNQLYYYQGGSPITYIIPEEDREEEGTDRISQSPNGWHRYRLTAGARMKISTPLSLTLFYMYQKEFNTGRDPFREIHYQKPSSSKIKQAFNDYSLLGLSITYTLKLY